MPMLPHLTSFFRSLIRKQRMEQDLDEEIRSHLELMTDHKMREGMNPQDAARAARIELGGVEQVKEQVRAVRAGLWLETLLQDLRFGARMLRKSPGFTVVAVLTLALGIGATTSVFSVVDRILFRSLPYPQADRLVSVGMSAPIEQSEFLFGATYLELREHSEPFEAVTSFTSGIINCDLTMRAPVRLSCARVDSTFLTTFGIQLLLGRSFTRDESLPNAPKVTLVSYGLWRSHFAADPSIVGKAISLDGQPTTIVGILPSEFEFPTLARVDMLVPQALDEAILRRSISGNVVRAFGRLKPSTTLPQATAALQPLFQYFLGQVPLPFREDIRLSVRPLRDLQVAGVRLALWVLLGAVLALLLITSANMANLLLARAAIRRREFAIRAALGAGHGRLVRQTLTESALLGLLGGVLGLGLAHVLLRLFIAIAPQGIPRLDQASLDSRVLLFALGISIGSGALFGLASVPPGALIHTLRGEGSGKAPRSLLRLLFASSQIALSIVLLSCAGLLLRSLWQMEHAPLGMDTDDVLTASIALNKYRYATAVQQYRFFEDLEDHIRQIPGVSAFALSDSLPPSGAMRARPFAAIEVEGRPNYAAGTGGMVAWRSVTPGYFRVLDIPLQRGRGFQEQDRGMDQNAVIVSGSLATLLFQTEEPLGRRLRFGPTGSWWTVVGVVGDVKNGGIVEQTAPEYYVVRKRTPDDAWDHSAVMIRSALDSQIVASQMHQGIAALDPTLPFMVDTMNQRVNLLAQRPRFNVALLVLFAGMGLVLAAIGVYGVVSYITNQRIHEVGIRMGLGAQRFDIMKMVIGEGIKLALVGTGVGIAGALALTRFLSSLLYGVEPTDPTTFVSVTLLLLGVALLACYIPARRATKVDPMVALRHQ